MRIGSKLQYEVPDECPHNCKLSDFLEQGGFCHRCPVFNCGGEDPLLRCDDYRDDWAEEWEKYFKTGEIPRLPLIATYTGETPKVGKVVIISFVRDDLDKVIIDGEEVVISNFEADILERMFSNRP